ncbi:hypothetical protein [Hallella sp.]|uniref:hypothetical protein n=1 Tax=Hallella sp. TaxID=2980186 RepID=UPI0038B34751
MKDLRRLADKLNIRMVGAMALGLTAFATAANAQDKVETTIAADVVSQYYWRGQELGAISLQPTLGIGYKGFSLTAWGSVGISEPSDTKEFDLTAAYSTGGFHIGVTDYWFNSPNERYFAYAAHETSHVFEANVGYDFGPVALNWYTNFAGNDGVNNDGDRAYSSYVEASAPFKLGGCDWQASIGAVPYATSFYDDAHGFAVTHVGLKATKDLKITDAFSVPVFAQVAANPSTEKAYLVVGFTLQP